MERRAGRGLRASEGEAEGNALNGIVFPRRRLRPQGWRTGSAEGGDAPLRGGQARAGAERREAMETALMSCLACMIFPSQRRVRPNSANPLEQINKEGKRRVDVIGIFPNEESIVRLIGVRHAPRTNGGSMAYPLRAERRVAAPAPVPADRRHGRARNTRRSPSIPHCRNRRRSMTDGRQSTHRFSTTLTDVTGANASGNF